LSQGKLHALRGQISYAMEQYEVRLCLSAVVLVALCAHVLVIALWPF
jgi:hypothetical protein